MAKGDEVAAVFEVLEKVFNQETEYEYDEALEELGLPVAKARKTYPNLFKAMKYPSRLETSPEQNKSNGQMEEIRAELQSLLAASRINGHRAEQAPAPIYQPREAPIAEIPPDEPAIRSTPYTEWALKEAQTCSVNQEFAVEWNTQAPMRQVGESFVLRRGTEYGGGRARFFVQGMYNERTMNLKMVALLPDDNG